MISHDEFMFLADCIHKIRIAETCIVTGLDPQAFDKKGLKYGAFCTAEALRNAAAVEQKGMKPLSAWIAAHIEEFSTPKSLWLELLRNPPECVTLIEDEAEKDGYCVIERLVSGELSKKKINYGAWRERCRNIRNNTNEDL